MDIQTFLGGIGEFLNGIVLPAIMAIAGLFFMVNAFRYFILGGADPDSQEKARTLALWGITAFVFILSIWGIVNILVEDIGMETTAPLEPDYLDVDMIRARRGTN